MTKDTSKFIRDHIPNIFCLCCFVLVIVFIGMGLQKASSDGQNDEIKCYPLQLEWYSLENNGEKTSIELPYSPTTSAGESSTISAILPDDLEDNMILCLRPDQIDMYISIDGQERLYYSNADTRLLGQVSARRYIFMPVNEEDSGKVIDVAITTTVASTGTFKALYYGTKYDVVRQYLSDNLLDPVIGSVMLIICLLCLIAGIVLSNAFKTFIDITYLAMVGILASIWILCNSEISQAYFPNVGLSTIVDYMMLLLLPFPFMFYMNNVQNRRYNKIYQVWEYVTMANVTVCTVLQIAGIKDYFQTFIFIGVVFGIAMILILVTTCIDIFKYKDHSYLIIAIGIFAGIISTLAQITLFVLGTYSFGGRAVAYALLIILATSIISTFKDVRAMEMEKQLAVAQGQAESSFLANMSHEIRTPINAVLGMNEMILREAKDPQVLEYADNIDNSGRMLLSIVNDILDFSKIRSGKMDIINDKYSLSVLVDAVCEMISSRADAKNLKFNVSIDTSMPNNLIGDEVRIKQVMINILTNAVKYTENGSVTLTVDMKKTEACDTVLHVSVKDTGKGIKQEDIGSLFDAFSRADEKNNRAIEGTGLGLALVDKLVTAMGGSVSVESEYGKGSTFSFEIPQEKVDDQTVYDVLKEDKPKPVRTEAAMSSFTAPTAKVLVVDDTKMNLLVLSGLLKRTKIQVTTADSGAKCLEILRKEKFDVILLDHLMPIMDGEETLKHIHEENIGNDAAIIAATANAIAGAKEQYMAMGFDDYLTKPINSAALEEMLKTYISEDKILAN